MSLIVRTLLATGLLLNAGAVAVHAEDLAACPDEIGCAAVAPPAAAAAQPALVVPARVYPGLTAMGFGLLGAGLALLVRVSRRPQAPTDGLGAARR